MALSVGALWRVCLYFSNQIQLPSTIRYFSNEIFIVNTNFITHFVLIIGTHLRWLVVVAVVIAVWVSLFWHFAPFLPFWSHILRWFLPFRRIFLSSSPSPSVPLRTILPVAQCSNVQNIISNEFLCVVALSTLLLLCVCVNVDGTAKSIKIPKRNQSYSRHKTQMLQPVQQ